MINLISSKHTNKAITHLALGRADRICMSIPKILDSTSLTSFQPRPRRSPLHPRLFTAGRARVQRR